MVFKYRSIAYKFIHGLSKMEEIVANEDKYFIFFFKSHQDKMHIKIGFFPKFLDNPQVLICIVCPSRWVMVITYCTATMSTRSNCVRNFFFVVATCKYIIGLEVCEWQSMRLPWGLFSSCEISTDCFTYHISLDVMLKHEDLFR